MEKHGEYYKATKGRHFVLTEKGVTEVASYKWYKAGDILEYGLSDEYLAHHIDLENGYVIEVEDPSWVTLPGYQAVFNNGDDILPAGSPRIFHDREMAECAANDYNTQPWRSPNDNKAYVISAIYEGKAPRPCREVDGKRILNADYWTYERPVGSLVEEKIVMDLADCVPPTTFSNWLIQSGEPHDHKEEGPTFATFLKVGKDIWEWRGYCFKGKTEESGTPIPYVK